jgi:hypothetical protein
MAVEGWTSDQAVSWMRLAGTATNYAGLYRTVERFRPPTDDALKKVPENFPETSPVSPLADVMIQVDGRFENLKLIRKMGYKTPPGHPDLEPAHEALLLDELLKELLRSSDFEKRPADFKSKLDEAEKAAAYLNKCLGSGLTNTTEISFQKLNAACLACHKDYRN